MRTYDFSKPIDLENLPATLKLSMARDPATLFPGAPPLFGQDVVPHFYTTTGYIGSAARAYPIEDEATRNSTENAERMRTECAIMECLESRQRATALLNWHLAPENDKSSKQQELCHVLTQIIRRIPRFVEYRRCLLEALWYGKYAVVNRFDSRRVGGKYRTTIKDWAPRHGDKLMFRYADDTTRFVEGQLGIRVHANFAHRPGQLMHLSDEERRKKIEPTQYGLVYWFNDYERETMVVHKHMIEDGPWQDPRMMGRVMGVGIRDRIYWTWYAMQSLLQDLLTYSNRAALGVRLWRYPSGNPEWKEKVEQAAKDALSNGVADVLFPVEPNDYASLYGVEQIEPGTAGAQLLAELIERFFLKKIKKYILGQLLTSEAESTGMGSGVANAHLATFADIVRYDASNLEETLTEQLVRKIQKENAPKSLGVHVRMVLDTDTPDTDKRLQAIQAAYQMDVPIRVEDIYQLTGLSKPEMRDQVVSVSSQQEKQQRQQNQMMMEQQAMQAAMMGVGGQAGAEGAPPEQVPPEGEEPAQSTLDVSPEDAEKDQGPAVPASGQLEEKAALDETPQENNPWAGFWESFFNAARGATEPDYEMQTQQTIQQVEEEADPELVSEFQRLFDAYAENNEDPDTFIEDVREAWERHALSQDLTEAFESHRLSERLNQGFEQQQLNTRIANGVEQQGLTWHMGRLFDQYELTNAISDKLAERMKQRGVREQLLTSLRKQFGKGAVERYAHQWAPYRGPREGKGWKNVSTGEVRYQEKSPDREMNPEDHLVHPRHPKNGNGTSTWRLKALDRERPYVGFDLDGTLAKSIKWQGPTVIGEPIPKMIAKVKAFLHHGVEVRIITARLGLPGKEAEAAHRAIVEWCKRYIGRKLKVQAVKTPGLVKLYDDKAVKVEENTGDTTAKDEYCADCGKYTWVAHRSRTGKPAWKNTATGEIRYQVNQPKDKEAAVESTDFNKPTSIKVNPSELSREVLSRMDRALKAMGYDSRGVDDLKNMLKTRMVKNGELWHEDWISAYQKAVSSVQSRQKTQEANRQSQSVLKNVNWTRLRQLGTTDNLREAGYIRPDGKLIDLSGKQEGGPAGSRALDHREAGGTAGMQELMSAGYIRHMPEAGGLDMTVVPTDSQWPMIRRMVRDNYGEVVLDLEDGLGEWDDRNEHYMQPARRWYAEYPRGTSFERIKSDIQKFYAGEDPPEPPVSRYTHTASEIDEAIQSWSPPTEGQAEAGNYLKPRIRLHGMEIAIENPKGTRRKPEWPELHCHYGYISRLGNQSASEDRDGDKVDVFVGPRAESEIVFVIDQETPAGRFDEHKVMLGFQCQDEAANAYLDNYTAGWHCGPITAMTVPQFKAWLECGDLTKRVAGQVSKYMATYEANPERYARKAKFDPRQKGFDFDAPKTMPAAAPAVPAAPASGQSVAGSPWVRMKGERGSTYWYNKITNPQNAPEGRKYQEEMPSEDDTVKKEAAVEESDKPWFLDPKKWAESPQGKRQKAEELASQDLTDWEHSEELEKSHKALMKSSGRYQQLEAKARRIAEDAILNNDDLPEEASDKDFGPEYVKLSREMGKMLVQYAVNNGMHVPDSVVKRPGVERPKPAADAEAEQQSSKKKSPADEASQLLDQAAPYMQFGEGYNRSIAQAANDLKEAMSREHGAKFIPHLAATLKMRLEAEGGNNRSGETEQSAGEPEQRQSQGDPRSMSREQLENTGYIPLYRGTDEQGFGGIKVTPGGVLGDGVYFYTEPDPARSHATWPRGGVLTGFARPEDLQIEGNVAVLRDTSKFVQRGKIPLEQTTESGKAWREITDRALSEQPASEPEQKQPQGELRIPETGKPFTFMSLHNNEKSPNMGARFGQDKEPAGRYVTAISDDDTYLTDAMPDKYERQEVTFENPLVIEFGGGYRDESNWKNVLSKKYGGLTGKKLSAAIRADGHDGIVTVEAERGPNRPAHTSEIVDLRQSRQPEQKQPDGRTDAAFAPAVWDAVQKALGSGQSVTFGTHTRATKITPKNRDALRFHNGEIQIRSGKNWQTIAFSALDSLAKGVGVKRPAMSSEDVEADEQESRDKWNRIVSDYFGGDWEKASDAIADSNMDYDQFIEYMEARKPSAPTGQRTIDGGIEPLPQPKSKPIESSKAKPQALFGKSGQPGQMNLFADKGVPDDLVGKPQKSGKIMSAVDEMGKPLGKVEITERVHKNWGIGKLENGQWALVNVHSGMVDLASFDKSRLLERMAIAGMAPERHSLSTDPDVEARRLYSLARDFYVAYHGGSV